MRDETYIAVLIDRSGSMGSIKNDVIGGFNEFLVRQRAAGSNALLTLVQFDSLHDVNIDQVHESLPINEVPDLTESTYQPRGNTPLLDALGKTIERTGQALKAIPESTRPDKVVFLIITDGQENASRTFTKARIAEMVTHQEQVYKWQFLYLGANVDAFAEADDMGIAMGAAANFSPLRMRAAYEVVAENVASYRSTNDARRLDYRKDQREKMVSDEK